MDTDFFIDSEFASSNLLPLKAKEKQNKKMSFKEMKE